MAVIAGSPSGSVDATNNIISFTALNASDGEFTAGLSTAFVAIPTLYSFISGSWGAATPRGQRIEICN